MEVKMDIKMIQFPKLLFSQEKHQSCFFLKLAKMILFMTLSFVDVSNSVSLHATFQHIGAAFHYLYTKYTHLSLCPHNYKWEQLKNCIKIKGGGLDDSVWIKSLMSIYSNAVTIFFLFFLSTLLKICFGTYLQLLVWKSVAFMLSLFTIANTASCQHKTW